MAAWLGVAAVGSMRSAHAQAVPLAPTADTTIVVSGPLHYSSILVPAGVTVRFVLPPIDPPPFHPAVVTCDGDAFVHGTLTLDGSLRYQAPNFTSAAGVVTTGRGLAGSFCGSTPFLPIQGGRHAGTYGSVLPFSLAGGSQGGDRRNLDSGCTVTLATFAGGEGGGTLVLLAGGRIEVDGTITADGQSTDSGGSGGSILLRGNRGVTILPGGSVSAQGAPGPLLYNPPNDRYNWGAPGYVRLDAWGRPPIVQGTIAPTPTALELPHARTLAQPRIGTTWLFEVFAPESSAVFAAASPIQGTGAPSVFGPMGIDLPSATILVYGAIAPTDHDPFVTVSTPVPNAPTLVGINFWVQAFVAPPALPPRFSNTLAVTVQ